MKYNGIAFLLCIAGLCPTLSGQHTGKGQVVSRRNLAGPIGLKFLLSLLPSDFDKLPDEIKVQIVHQMIVTMPLNNALQTLSSLASTNRDWDRISHDKAFDLYWALIHDKNLFKALHEKNLINAIQIIQQNPALQNIDNHSWAIIFHKMIDYLPTDLIENVLNFAFDPQAIAAFRIAHKSSTFFSTVQEGLNNWLLESSKHNDAAEILYALIAGADINFGEFLGKPVLVEAVKGNNSFIVRLLLDNGVEINGVYFGDTALGQAVARGYVDIVKLLLDYAADRKVALNLSSFHLNFLKSFPSYLLKPEEAEIIQLIENYKI